MPQNVYKCHIQDPSVWDGRMMTSDCESPNTLIQELLPVMQRYTLGSHGTVYSISWLFISQSYVRFNLVNPCNVKLFHRNPLLMDFSFAFIWIVYDFEMILIPFWYYLKIFKKVLQVPNMLYYNKYGIVISNVTTKNRITMV